MKGGRSEITETSLRMRCVFDAVSVHHNHYSKIIQFRQEVFGILMKNHRIAQIGDAYIVNIDGVYTICN